MAETNNIKPNKKPTLVDIVYEILLAAYLESLQGRSLKLYYIRSLKDLVDTRMSEVLEERPSPIREFLCYNGWVPASVLIQQPGIDFQPGALNAVRKLRSRKTVAEIEIHRTKEGHTLYRLILNQSEPIKMTKEPQVAPQEEEVK